jgi:hypothetical protein
LGGKLSKSLDYIENFLALKFRKILQKPAIILCSIACIGLILRLSIFPYEIPFTLDAIDYFSYAVLTTQHGEFPEGFKLANNGWPGFVSIFFSLLNTNDFFELVHLQRFLSVIISVITIIPVYLLSRRFFERSFSYIAVALFVFDYRIMLNSLTGGNIPLFIFLTTLGIFFFLSKNIKIIYLSFGILALASIIRYEGLVLLIPFSIMFFVRLHKQKYIVFKYFMVISITILVLLPIAYIRLEKTGEDGLISHLLAGTTYVSTDLKGFAPDGTPNDEPWIKPNQDNLGPFIISGLTGLIRYLSWITVPTFMLFLPASIFFILKNQRYKKIDDKTLTIIVIGLFMLLPAFYMYGRHFQETKYLYVLFPIICLFSIYSLNIIKSKKSLFSFFVFVAILFLTIGVIYLQNLNATYEHDREAFKISLFIVNNVDGINRFSPESEFVKPAEVFKKWPNIPSTDPFGPEGHLLRDIKFFSTNGYESLEKFIEDTKGRGLSHIFVDGRPDRSSLENNLFLNEKSYPYLIKEFDSIEHGLKYHVKIFKIDYDIFENSEYNE